MDTTTSTSAKPEKPIFSKGLITILILIVAAIAAYFITGDSGQYGIFSLLPVVAVFLTAVITHRPFEAMIVGNVVAVVMIAPTDFFGKIMTTSLTVLADPVTGWLLLLTLLFGALIALLHLSGGVLGFSEWLSRKVDSREKLLMSTWLMGIVIFIDDYLNCLAVSSSVTRIADKYKVSRQMLAYVVDSTAAPMCVIVPISTWAVFIIGLFHANGIAVEGTGFSYYLSAIPYIFYAWIAVLFVPLVASGIIPAIGPMKKAEQDALTADYAPVKSDNMDRTEQGRIINFILPIAVVAAATLYFGTDTLMGVIVGLVFTVPFFIFQRLAKSEKIFDEILSGMASMALPMSVVLLAFVLQRFNDELGLSTFIIESATPHIAGAWLPAIAFLVLSFLTFTTGSFWGVYAISLPIIYPLIGVLDANELVTIGAVLSAGVFGSHACFYGDSTLLTAKGSGCTPMSHALTQLPYSLIAGAIAFAMYAYFGHQA